MRNAGLPLGSVTPVLFVLILLSVSCGGGGSVTLPGNQIDPQGVYEGFIYVGENKLGTRLEVSPIDEGGKFLCRLVYIDGENVEPAPGRGSIYGFNLSAVIAPNTDHPFYIVGTLDPEKGLISGRISFPDEDDEFSFDFFYRGKIQAEE